ncbi:MAG TPA: CAP domain-containing protein [Phototrophicaceae bacterium]|nr:CAP domain-containing protein [Phototrophicaceae bacterium]
MRWKIVLLLLCLLTVLPVQAQSASDLLALINNLRAGHGLPAYSLNSALMVAAQQQAQWIIDTGTIAHTHPDGSGPRTRAVAAGYGGALIGENIYGGTNASLNDAWVFWLNSPIHYEGLVNTSYQQVGIGIAHGSWGSSYVIDFGGDGSSYVPVGAANNGGGNGSSHPAAAAGPPPYYGGLDDQGNIKHIVQPGETLGDIALLYGYSWSDLPTLMQLNGLSNVRDLAAGSIFLVPPKGGTYTPTPDNRPPTETPVPSPIPPTITMFALPTTNGATQAIPSPQPTSLIATAGANVAPPPDSSIATAGANVAPPADDPSPTIVEVAQLATSAVQGAVQPPAPVRSTMSTTTWILIALGVQAMIVVGAGIEFLRRTLRKRR